MRSKTEARFASAVLRPANCLAKENIRRMKKWLVLCTITATLFAQGAGRGAVNNAEVPGRFLLFQGEYIANGARQVAVFRMNTATGATSIYVAGVLDGKIVNSWLPIQESDK